MLMPRGARSTLQEQPVTVLGAHIRVVVRLEIVVVVFDRRGVESVAKERLAGGQPAELFGELALLKGMDPG